MRKFLKSEDGFSLIEVLVSLVLLSIGGLALAFVVGSSLHMLGDSSTLAIGEAAGDVEAGTGTSTPGTMTIIFPSEAVGVDGDYITSGPYTVFVPS